MGGRGSSSGRKRGIPPSVSANVQYSVQQPQVVNDDSTTPKRSGRYTNMTDADAINIMNKYQYAYGDPDFVAAQKMYISGANVNGDGYSYSQNLNFKLDNGLKLDANEAWINDNLQNAMHSIGKNTNLVRYCHDDILKKCGISDYTKMTESQLKSSLVGMQLKSSGYVSTSYNPAKSPFHPNASLGGGREVVMKIKADKNTKVVLGAKKQTEVILNKGTNLKITNVRYDGSTASPRNGRTKPRIEIEIEAY